MLDAANVMMNVEAATQDQLIRAMVTRAQELGKVTDVETTVQAVLERERESTTGFGKGVAIPHGKTSAVTEPALLFARCAQAVEWQSLDGGPVDAVFMILVPEESAAEHLQILAKLARKLMHDDFVTALKRLTTAADVSHYVEEQLA